MEQRERKGRGKYIQNTIGNLVLYFLKSIYVYYIRYRVDAVAVPLPVWKRAHLPCQYQLPGAPMNKRDPFCKNRINLEIALRLRLTMQILCHDRSEVPNKRAHAAYPNQPNRTEPPKILTEPYPTQPKPKPNLEWA